MINFGYFNRTVFQIRNETENRFVNELNRCSLQSQTYDFRFSKYCKICTNNKEHSQVKARHLYNQSDFGFPENTPKKKKIFKNTFN